MKRQSPQTIWQRICPSSRGTTPPVCPFTDGSLSVADYDPQITA